MQHKILLRLLPLCALLTALTACSGNVKETLGISKSVPDEFKVVSNLPLSIPPDFRLPTPTPGAKRPQQIEMHERAKASVFGTQPQINDSGRDRYGVSASSLTSRGESALLARAQADKADPRIRELLDEAERTQTLEQKEGGVWSKITSFGNSDDAPALNALEEKKRITEAKKNGEAITGEDTVVIDDSEKSMLDRLLN